MPALGAVVPPKEDGRLSGDAAPGRSAPQDASGMRAELRRRKLRSSGAPSFSPGTGELPLLRRGRRPAAAAAAAGGPRVRAERAFANQGCAPEKPGLKT